MIKSPESPYPPEDAGAHGADVDPWNEFLSESSEDPSNHRNPASLFDSEHDLARSAEAPAATSSPVETLPAWAVTQAATWALTDPPRAASSAAASRASADERRSNGIADGDGFRSASNAWTSTEARSQEAGSLTVPVRETLALVRVDPRALALSTTGAITLADIVSRHVPVQWPEAVATVEELCAALRDDPDTAIPELNDVLITQTGQVVVRPDARGERDIRMIGLTLHALLSTGDTPLPLRLFVTSSTSSQRYGSIAVYADALSLYAVPTASRSDLIAALYRRSLNFSPVPAVTHLSAFDDGQLVSHRGRNRDGRRVSALAVAAATALVCGAAVTFWLWQTSTAGAAAPVASVDPPSTAVTPADPGPVEASRPSRRKPRDDWRPGVVLEASGRRQVPEGEPGLAGLSLPLTPTGPVVLSPRNSDAPAPVALPSQPDRSSPPPVGDRVSSPERTGAALLAPIATTGTSIDPTIYSRDDADVLPPVMLSPPMRSYGKPGSTPESGVSNTLELLIDEKGGVASVKWVERPQRFIDAMEPQSAKNLKFRPAVRNGVPVKYRLYIPWLVQTPG